MSKYAEEAKVAIRNVRRDSNERYKKMEKDSQISEDDLKKYAKEVQDVTDEFIVKVDEVFKVKEKEILEGN
ncbi:Ribosome-recycling factor [bioreactor metagenome]|uniref:Ribosome-recycling factor n=1 Tax=bioreactor metagenome TaxID=1076179 RepID=A0A645J336_9ZZZZ